MGVEQEEADRLGRSFRGSLDRRIGYAVVAADHDRDGSKVQNAGDATLQSGIAFRRVARNDVDIAGIDNLETLECVKVPVEVIGPEQQRVFADLLWSTAGRSAAKGGNAVIGHPD